MIKLALGRLSSSARLARQSHMVRGPAIGVSRPSAAGILVLLGALAGVGVARGQNVTEFPVPAPGSAPSHIATGADGNLWFTEAAGNQIGRITTSGVITEFPIPTAGSGPVGIAAGADGNLWFAEQNANQIGRITRAGVVTEFPIPTAGSGPWGISAGPDGNLWFTESTGNQIGRITTTGVVTEFPIPTVASNPRGIAAGPDDSLWFTESAGNSIGRITTAGVITEFPVTTAGSAPSHIAAGPDGNLWFTESAGNQIGQITTSGVVTEFPITAAGSGPRGIAAGVDGNLWFAEQNANQIGRITTAGVVAEFAIPTPGGGLPSPWAQQDIGAVGLPGSASYSGGTFTVIGSGTDIEEVSDEFHYVYQSLSGDGTILARVASLQDTDPFAKGGVMIRETLTGDSTHAAMVLTPENGVFFQRRITTGALTVDTQGASVVAPFWVKVVRSGDTFSGYSSPDGINWTLVGSDTIVMAADVFYGLAVTAHNNTVTCTATFDGVGPPPGSLPLGIAAGPDGNLWFTEEEGNAIGRIPTGPTTPQHMAVDTHAVTGSISNANGVLEPDETVLIAPSWENTLTDPQTFTGLASNLIGPPGPNYFIDDTTADYGTLGAGAIGDCDGATADCYRMTVSGIRPAVHWDATFTEDLSPNSVSKTWTLHIGGSFVDVSTDIVVDPYYPFIETMLHHQVSAGCQDGTVFCPADPTTREQMAVFLLKASQGATFHPPACTGIFSDVPCTPGVGFSDWIENLANRGITAGCQPGPPPAYCPTREVLRSEMAVFLLKASQGSAYDPPDCTGIFADVPCTPGVGFADWIEDLYNRGVTSGCQVNPLMYCPDNHILRQEMAVFLSKVFGLQLYGP